MRMKQNINQFDLRLKKLLTVNGVERGKLACS